MRYQVVLQHSQEDCGAASLATVAKHYGRTFTLNRVREAVGTGSRGTTLLGLRRGAETLGFHTRQVQATAQLIEKLNEVPLPAIIHSKGYDWVVFYESNSSSKRSLLSIKYLSKVVTCYRLKW